MNKWMDGSLVRASGVCCVRHCKRMNSKQNNEKKRTPAERTETNYQLFLWRSMFVSFTRSPVPSRPLRSNISHTNCESIDILDLLAEQVVFFPLFFHWNSICGAAVHCLILSANSGKRAILNVSVMFERRKWRKNTNEAIRHYLCLHFDASQTQYYSQINLEHIGPSKRSGVANQQVHRPLFLRVLVATKQKRTLTGIRYIFLFIWSHWMDTGCSVFRCRHCSRRRRRFPRVQREVINMFSSTHTEFAYPKPCTNFTVDRTKATAIERGAERER